MMYTKIYRRQCALRIDVTRKTNTYEGWNFNRGNYLFTTDTKQIHVSKFYCPSIQSPALCTTRCQRCGNRRIPLAAPVVLVVRMERSTAGRISGTVLKRMPRSGSFILGINWKSQGLTLKDSKTSKHVSILYQL